MHGRSLPGRPSGGRAARAPAAARPLGDDDAPPTGRRRRRAAGARPRGAVPPGAPCPDRRSPSAVPDLPADCRSPPSRPRRRRPHTVELPRRGFPGGGRSARPEPAGRVRRVRPAGASGRCAVRASAAARPLGDDDAPPTGRRRRRAARPPRPGCHAPTCQPTAACRPPPSLPPAAPPADRRPPTRPCRPSTASRLPIAVRRPLRPAAQGGPVVPPLGRCRAPVGGPGRPAGLSGLAVSRAWACWHSGEHPGSR